MKKVATVFIVGFIILISNESIAQGNSIVKALDDFLSKLYFPSEFGMNYPINNNHLKYGVLFTTGIEFRFKPDKGIFLRFNYDNLSNSYQIDENSQTNALKSRIKTDLIMLGAGYRFGKTKIKYHVMLQLGRNQSQYPVVHGIGPNSYHVTFGSVYSFATKVGLGLEYYVSNEFIITIEPQYLYMPGESIFWEENYNNFGVKLGFSALLF